MLDNFTTITWSEVNAKEKLPYTATKYALETN